MPDPGAVLTRLTDRLAPLERDLHHAFWAASTKAGPETSAARQRAEEALLAALGDPGLFAEVQGALAASGPGRTRRALEQAGLDLLANQIPEGDRAQLVALQAKVEHAFSTVRGRVGGKELANNELERVLATSSSPPASRFWPPRPSSTPASGPASGSPPASSTPGTTATCSSSASTARARPTLARCWRAATPSR
jgi:hypothetical protein